MSQKRKETPSEKAQRIDRWTEILFKALSARAAKRWRFASFRGAGGGEWRGIVDVLAVRKNTAKPGDSRLKRGDLFELILVQMKGGSARMPNEEEKKRLEAVKQRYGAKEVVLFCWKEGKGCTFSKLTGMEWIVSSPTEIFGLKSTAS